MVNNMDLMPENPIQEKKKGKVSIPLIIVLVLIINNSSCYNMDICSKTTKPTI